MATEKRTLYEIDQAILNCLDAETGEILDFAQLEQLQVERDQKIEGVALYIKELNSAAAAIKAEEAALVERRKAKEAKADRLKEYLNRALGGQPFETARVRLSFRRSMKVEISDPLTLLEWLEDHNKEECLTYKMPDINKTEVGKLMKAGEVVPGAILTESQNLQLK